MVFSFARVNARALRPRGSCRESPRESPDRGSCLIMRIRNVLIFIAVAAAFGMASASALASPQAVIRDCAKDGTLNHHYSLSDLKNALKKLPTDVDEYTNCRDVINQAETQGSGGGSAGGSGPGGPGGAGGGGGNSGGPGPSAADTRALNSAIHSNGSAPTLSLGGRKVVPGSGGLFKTASATGSLPVPVLLALIAVAALTAAGGFVAVRRRFPAAVGAALRVPQAVGTRLRVPQVLGAALRIFRR